MLVEVIVMPEEQQQHAENHTAQMRKVRHTVGGAQHAVCQFDDTENQHEPLGLDGEQEVDVNQVVREQPAEGQQYAVDGT